MAEPVVFVIGAGASKVYGLPTGSELRDQICDGDGQSIIKHEPGLSGHRAEEYEKNLRSMRESFHKSRIQSIDRFLELNNNFSEMGKKSIASIIYHSEMDSNTHTKECWLSWIYNRMIENNGSEMKDWPIKFIIFNYDRIVEYMIAEMYSHTFFCPISESLKLLRQKIEIIHPYGVIPDHPALLETEQMHLNFGMGSTSLEDMARGIRVIGEERKDYDWGTVDNKIKSVVNSASTMVYLGFGFDRTNVSLLYTGHNSTVKSNIKHYSTGYGMKKREKSDACELVGSNIVFGSMKESCLDFLREHVSI